MSNVIPIFTLESLLLPAIYILLLTGKNCMIKMTKPIAYFYFDLQRSTKSFKEELSLTNFELLLFFDQQPFIRCIPDRQHVQLFNLFHYSLVGQTEPFFSLENPVLGYSLAIQYAAISTEVYPLRMRHDLICCSTYRNPEGSHEGNCNSQYVCMCGRLGIWLYN